MNKVLASALLSIGLAAPLAMAQTANPPAGGPQGRPGMHQHQNRAFSMPSERIEAQLAYIKTALKITDAQTPQWNAFADTMRKQAAERDKLVRARREQMGQRKPGEQPNAIARLERQQKMLADAAANASQRLAVQKPLYAVLSPEQKQVADTVLVSGFGRGGFGGRGGHHGRHRNV